MQGPLGNDLVFLLACHGLDCQGGVYVHGFCCPQLRLLEESDGQR
jgi:hypothetical protein